MSGCQKALPELWIVTRFSLAGSQGESRSPGIWVFWPCGTKLAQLTSFHTLTVLCLHRREIFSFCRRSPLPQRGKMLTQLHFPWKNQPSWLGERGKILGSFKCKDSEGGKWKYDHFPDMKSRARQDSIMIFLRIGWTSFPFLPWTVFSREWGGREEMERDSYDWYRDGCQHKLESLFFFPLPVREAAA